MQTFKKILIVFLVLVIIIGGVSALIIEPMNDEGNYFCDAKLRKSLAGTIDFVYVGDSDGMTGFHPEVFDGKTDRTSYNLSGSMMTMHSRYYLLKKEIARNPIQSVVIQISPEALWRKNTNYGDGDSVTLSRLDTVGERIGYLLRYVSVDDWLNIYSRQMISGFAYWKDRLSNGKTVRIDYSARGWKKSLPVDVRLSPEEAVSIYNTKQFEADFYDVSVKELEDVISLCNDNSIQVIIVSQPFADAWIWEFDDWDGYGGWLNEFCEENNCTYIDFNLLKNRYEVFSDESSFTDTVHMSELGADAFTAVLADVLTDFYEDGHIDDTLFYASYEEMKQDSPYFSYLQTP